MCILLNQWLYSNLSKEHKSLYTCVFVMTDVWTSKQAGIRKGALSAQECLALDQINAIVYRVNKEGISWLSDNAVSRLNIQVLSREQLCKQCFKWVGTGVRSYMIVELTESKEQWKLEIKYERRKQVGSSWTAPKDRETYFPKWRNVDYKGKWKKGDLSNFHWGKKKKHSA